MTTSVGFFSLVRSHSLCALSDHGPLPPPSHDGDARLSAEHSAPCGVCELRCARLLTLAIALSGSVESDASRPLFSLRHTRHKPHRGPVRTEQNGQVTYY